ncbi:hypothetical protein [Streptomyces puniciscabiei]|uniref:hypothetical protein n=1 Tax=Streptomyces puniciscabiei TaxID=164348 RepID=UPI0033187AAF
MSQHRRDTYFQDLFWTHLAGLRTAAGELHERELIDDAASKKGVAIADATLNDWFRRKSVPGPRTLKQFTALVEVLQQRARIRHGPRYEQHDVDFERLRADAYKERFRRNKGKDKAGETLPAASAGIGRLVDQISDPFELEVHQPIDIPGADDLDPLPAYVERKHDRQLRKVVRDTDKGQSGIAVLIGPSSSGKTRACWEALHVLPVGWRLWRPTDPSTAVSQLPEVSSRTVIWLDDTHDSFLVTPEPGEALARGLSDLLHDTRRAPVLVMSTMWPDTWDALTTEPPRGTDDPHKRARTLLIGHGISVPHAFDNEKDLAELKAKAAGDPRLARALAEAEDGEITQFLAGVPVLLERYDTAPDGAKALIWAAMDARRLGHSRALPLPFLQAAAPGYLTASQWNRLARQRSWLEQALRYVEADCRGARGPLTPIHALPGDPQLVL